MCGYLVFLNTDQLEEDRTLTLRRVLSVQLPTTGIAGVFAYLVSLLKLVMKH